MTLFVVVDDGTCYSAKRVELLTEQEKVLGEVVQTYAAQHPEVRGHLHAFYREEDDSVVIAKNIHPLTGAEIIARLPVTML